uniref:Uncharacterized protein n=1 Tax=Arundo donax TaxID=35708 RepID=A0A0A9E0M9_ARUDO
MGRDPLLQHKVYHQESYIWSSLFVKYDKSSGHGRPTESPKSLRPQKTPLNVCRCQLCAATAFNDGLV